MAKVSDIRGYRNNNPLNIIHSSNKWKGMCEEQTDKRFVQFESMFYGFRAAVIILCRSYYLRGWWTPESIISHWAPSTENNTQAYIAAVCQRTGLKPNTKIPRPELASKKVWIVFIIAMVVVECGEWRPELRYDLEKAYLNVTGKDERK